MSRTGVEPKPEWRRVPAVVRQAVANALGAPVARAERVYGGYGPSPTFRLRLTDGRRVFFKAASPDDNPFIHAAHPREEQIYRELHPLIANWSPAFFAAFEAGGWKVMLLEDLGAKTAPPWTRAAIVGTARGVGEFHSATKGHPFPDWLPRPDGFLSAGDHDWSRIAGSGLGPLAAVARDLAPDALRWLEQWLPALAQASRTIAEGGEPFSLLHRDIRSDNLRWRQGRLRLFDWPHAGVGPAEYDAVAFAQSVEVEGGPSAEDVMRWYGETFPARAELIDSAAAALAGFFATHSTGPEIPGLPRLRAFQRAQLRVTLAWAAQRLKLPEPSWLRGVPV